MAFDDDQLMHAEVGLSLPLEKFEAELDRAFGDFRARVESADQLSAAADLGLNLEPFKRAKKEVQAEIKELELRKAELGVGISDSDKAKLLAELAELHAKAKAITKDRLLFEVDLSKVRELQAMERNNSREKRERELAQRAYEDAAQKALERRINLEKKSRVEESRAWQENYDRDKRKAAGLEKDEEAAYKRDQARTNEKLKAYNAEKAAAAGLVKEEEAAYRLEDGRNKERIRNLERIESLYRQRRANDEVAVISEKGAAQRVREDLLNKEKQVNAVRQYRALGDDIAKKNKEPKVVDLDIKRAEIKLALLRGQIESLGGDVNLNLDVNKGLLTKLRGLKEDVKDEGLTNVAFSALRTGAKYGQKRGGSFLSGLSSQDLVPGPLHVSLGAALKASPVILPALGSLTSLVGTTGYGLAGAGAVGGGLGAGLVGNFIGLAGALFKTKTEFESVSKAEQRWEEQVRKTGAGSLLAQKAFNEFQDVLHAVGPTAAKSEQELQKLLHTWTKFTQPARNAIVDVVGEVGRRGRALIPGFARNTNETAGIIRDHSRTFLDHVTSPEEIKRLDQLGKSANNFFDHALTGAENLAGALFHIGEAGARIFGGKLGEAFQHWAEGFNQANKPGKELDATVRHLGEDAQDVWHFLEALTHVLLDLFGGSRKAGEQLFKSMTEGLEGWDRQLKTVEGKKGMEKFFKESNELVKNLFPIFKEFAVLLGEWAIGLIPVTKGILKVGAEVTKIVMDVSKLVGFNEPLVAMGEAIAGIFLYKKFAAAVEATKLIYQNLKNAGGFIEALKTIGKGDLFKKTGVDSRLEEGVKVGSQMWYEAIVKGATDGAVILREGGGVARAGGSTTSTTSTASKAGSVEKDAESLAATAVAGGFLSKLKGLGKLGLKGGASAFGGYFGGQLLGELTGSSQHTTGVLSSVGAGAAGGFAVGGPLGAVAGAGLGLITSGGTKDLHNLIFGGPSTADKQNNKDVDTLNRISEALKQVGGHLDKLNPQQLKEMNREINKLGHSNATNEWAGELARLRKETSPAAQGARIVAEAWKNSGVSVHTSLHDIREYAKSTADSIKWEMGTKSAEAKAALSSNFADAAGAVNRQMYLTGHYTSKGLEAVQEMFSKALAIYGVKAPKGLTSENFQSALNSLQQGGNVTFNEKGAPVELPHAQGGMVQFGQQGERGQDSIRTNLLVAPGEVGAVFTAQQQEVANTLLAPVGGLPGLFSNYNTPHYMMAKGGLVGGLGGVHAGAAKVASDLERHFPKLHISSTTSGEHAEGSYHYKGEAVDEADGTGGSPYMDAAAAWLAHTWGTSLTEGIHNPNLSIKYGHDVPSSYWGSTTWAGHKDHIHLAVTGGAPVSGAGLPAITGEGGPERIYHPFGAPHVKGTGIGQKLGQGVVSKAAAAANAYIARALGQGGGGSGNFVVGGSLKSLNHVFKAGVKLSVPLIEKIANWAGLPGHTFAQIAHGESDYEPGQIEPTESTGIGGVPVKGYGLWQITTGVGNDKMINSLGGTRMMLNPLVNAHAAKILYDGAGHSISPWHGTKYVTKASTGFYSGGSGKVVATGGSKKPPVKSVLSTPGDLKQLPLLSEAAMGHGVPAEVIHPAVSDIEKALKTEKTTYAKLGVSEKKGLEKLAKDKSAAAHAVVMAAARQKNSVAAAKEAASHASASAGHSVASAERTVRNNPADPKGHEKLAEAKVKAGEATQRAASAVRRAETSGSLGLQNAKFHGNATVKAAAKALEDIRKGRQTLVRGGEWHGEKWIALSKLEKDQTQGRRAENELKSYEKKIASLNRSIKNVTHGMNIDSSRFKKADPKTKAALTSDWNAKLGTRKGLIEQLKGAVGASKSDAEKFAHDHPHSPHIKEINSYLESLDDTIEGIEDQESETEGYEEGGISGAGSSALSPEGYIESLPGKTDELKELEEAYALSQTQVTPDNPNTPPNEELPGLEGEVGPAKKLQGFWEGILQSAQGNPNIKPETITQIAQQVTSARGTAIGLENTIESAKKGQASQAFQESQAFSTARLELYKNYGSNFSPIWTKPATQLGGGAGGGPGGAGPAGKVVNVNVTNNFSHPPSDPHTWSNGVGWELQAAI